MDGLRKLIQDLRRKLGHALTLHRQLKDQLLKEQSRHQQTMVEKQALENEIRGLKEQLKTLKLAQAIHGDNDQSTREMKVQINQYIREIDKCLLLINKD